MLFTTIPNNNISAVAHSGLRKARAYSLSVNQNSNHGYIDPGFLLNSNKIDENTLNELSHNVYARIKLKSSNNSSAKPFSVNRGTSKHEEMTSNEQVETNELTNLKNNQIVKIIKQVKTIKKAQTNNYDDNQDYYYLVKQLNNLVIQDDMQDIIIDEYKVIDKYYNNYGCKPENHLVGKIKSSVLEFVQIEHGYNNHVRVNDNNLSNLANTNPKNASTNFVHNNNSMHHINKISINPLRLKLFRTKSFDNIGLIIKNNNHNNVDTTLTNHHVNLTYYKTNVKNTSYKNEMDTINITLEIEQKNMRDVTIKNTTAFKTIDQIEQLNNDIITYLINTNKSSSALLNNVDIIANDLNMKYENIRSIAQRITIQSKKLFTTYNQNRKININRVNNHIEIIPLNTSSRTSAICTDTLKYRIQEYFDRLTQAQITKQIISNVLDEFVEDKAHKKKTNKITSLNRLETPIYKTNDITKELMVEIDKIVTQTNDEISSNKSALYHSDDYIKDENIIVKLMIKSIIYKFKTSKTEIVNEYEKFLTKINNCVMDCNRNNSNDNCVLYGYTDYEDWKQNKNNTIRINTKQQLISWINGKHFYCFNSNINETNNHKESYGKAVVYLVYK